MCHHKPNGSAAMQHIEPNKIKIVETRPTLFVLPFRCSKLSNSVMRYKQLYPNELISSEAKYFKANFLDKINNFNLLLLFWLS